MNRFLTILFLSLVLLPLRAQQPASGDSLVIEACADTLQGGEKIECTPQPTHDDSLFHAWQMRIDSLLEDEMFEHSQVAIIVRDLTADTLVISHNARQLMRPASTQKVVTAVTALSQLGTDYDYTTSLFSSGVRKGGTLDGNLFLKGGFDPTFERLDLVKFARSVAKEGIRSISGDLVIDVTFKDTISKGWGWCWDDDDKQLSPLTCKGCDDVAQSLLLELKKEGVSVAGVTRSGKVPQGAKLICRKRTPISRPLQEMMKESDNFYAESMFYQLAAKSGRLHATRKDAARRINRLIRKIGLKPTDYKIADGSGLSLYNYITAELLAKFLQHAYEEKHIYNVLQPSLPIAGCDGTLENRMLHTSACGRVRAKTGSVNSISTLAGYAEADNGHVLCFVIFNQGLLKTRMGRAFQDAVCTALCDPLSPIQEK